MEEKQEEDPLPVQMDFFEYLDSPLKIKSDFEAITFFNSLSQDRKNDCLFGLLLMIARGELG